MAGAASQNKFSSEASGVAGSESVLRLHILGCGSSGGVPRIGNNWGACDPREPKNRRTRCSVLVQRGVRSAFSHADVSSVSSKISSYGNSVLEQSVSGDNNNRSKKKNDAQRSDAQRSNNDANGKSGHVTSALIDTSPDMREQLLRVRVGELDGVLFTHSHADQCHGLDDLRVVSVNIRERVKCHADPYTANVLRSRFDYCFEQQGGSPYPAVLQLAGDLVPGKPCVISGAGGGVEFVPFLQYHGHISSLGFRVGKAAYSSDVVDLPDESFEILDGVDIWVLDCLRYAPHPTHAHLDKCLAWIERVRPKRAVLTNLHVDLDYNELKSKLPPHVEPAYDGMMLDI